MDNRYFRYYRWRADLKMELSHTDNMLFSHSAVSKSLRPYGLQHARLPCPSLSPGVCSNSCPLN